MKPKRPCKRWTPDELAFLRENYGKILAEEIAERLQRTVGSVAHQANRLGIPSRKYWTPDEIAFLHDNCSQIPIDEIAEQLGRTVTSVRRQIDRTVPTGGERIWTPEEDRYLRDNNGLIPYDEMEIERTPGAIYRRVRLLGLRPNGMRCPACADNFCSPAAKMCASCYRRRSQSKLGKGRFYMKRDGYVVLGISAIPQEDWPLVYPMMNSPGNSNVIGKILEHRYIMARHLGRPLERKEVVHHRNGIRDDNRIENLQLFRVGNHHRGHGHYYHEWQIALAEIEKLRSKIAELESLLEQPD